jgi:DNA modification methylase
MTDITRIIGDSFKILPTLFDKSVDLILVDPPYDLNEQDKLFLHEEFKRISKGAIIVFMPPENQWILPADQYLFWTKPMSTKNTSKSYSRFVEMIFVYNVTTWNCKRHWSQYTNVFTDLVDDTKLHTYRKPPSLIERLLLNHTNKGDLILDPFAGSFVVADVSERLNRNCIAIEINKQLMAE